MSRMNFLLIPLLVAACSDTGDNDIENTADGPDSLMPTATVAQASAALRDSTGRDLGSLVLVESDSGIQVTGRLTGLAQGEHGLHIHTVGSCNPTFEAAGEHWNPESRQHGTDNSAGPHRGDLLNLQVQSDSAGSITSVTRGGRLEDLFDSDGSAVVVHVSADDYRTDPDGNSGGRVACGVVMRGM
jgi:Cu-Zn family superoxide dismutase